MENRAAARGVRSIRKCEIAGDARYAVKYTRAEFFEFYFCPFSEEKWFLNIRERERERVSGDVFSDVSLDRIAPSFFCGLCLHIALIARCSCGSFTSRAPRLFETLETWDTRVIRNASRIPTVRASQKLVSYLAVQTRRIPRGSLVSFAA